MFQDWHNEPGPRSSIRSSTDTLAFIAFNTDNMATGKEGNFEKRKQDYTDYFKKHPHIMRNDCEE